MDKISLPLSRRDHAGGFSLVEVALAIGIIAFAFIALFSLMPTGLTTYRSAIDTGNETWILQGMNSMVQTTDFSKIDDLSFKKSGEIFYFDEEGKATDREKQAPAASAEVKATRLYAVKLVTQRLFRPDGNSQSPSGDPQGSTSSDPRVMNHGWRIIVVFAPYQDPKAMAEFKPIQDEATLKALPAESNVHTRSFYVARMDSANL
jgi:uncharacterized protein (TIGR02598 family)